MCTNSQYIITVYWESDLWKVSPCSWITGSRKRISPIQEEISLVFMLHLTNANDCKNSRLCQKSIYMFTKEEVGRLLKVESTCLHKTLQKSYLLPAFPIWQFMIKVETSIYRMLKCCGFQPIPPTLKLTEFLPQNFCIVMKLGNYGSILPIYQLRGCP